MHQNYLEIPTNKIEEYFNVNSFKNKSVLSSCNLSNSISVKNPFVLNEDVATLAGLMPDGSLIKDLMRIYFYQKKDISKVYLFESLIKNLFVPTSKVFISRKVTDVVDTICYVNSKTLANFFYYILEIPKSNEPMNVPKWIFRSQKSVKISYLKQVFDMEGTILNNLKEMRFVSKDKIFAENVKKLLRSIGIESRLNIAPRLKQKSPQYRVHIYGKENFVKFKEIGFRIPFLKNRFDELLKKYGIS